MKSPRTEPSPASEGKAYDYASLNEAFPPVDAGLKPYGDRVLVQMRTPKTVSAGGIIIPEETRDTEMWNTQIAKVIAIGPTAFVNQDTLVPWVEGAWCKVGDFIRVPKYGGDRWQVRVPDTRDYALFVTFRELDLIGECTVDPLSVVAYLY